VNTADMAAMATAAVITLKTFAIHSSPDPEPRITW